MGLPQPNTQYQRHSPRHSVADNMEPAPEIAGDPVQPTIIPRSIICFIPATSSCARQNSIIRATQLHIDSKGVTEGMPLGRGRQCRINSQQLGRSRRTRVGGVGHGSVHQEAVRKEVPGLGRDAERAERDCLPRVPNSDSGRRTEHRCGGASNVGEYLTAILSTRLFSTPFIGKPSARR